MNIIFGFALILAAVDDQPSRFKAATRKPDDTVAVQGDRDKTAFIVKSPSGISHAVIERLEESWPKVVVLRLHLKGLECLRLSNGKTTIDAAVSIQDGAPKIRLWKDGKEDLPLDEKSPFWTDIRMVGSDGKPAKELPLTSGYFEVTLPRAFFEGNPQSITGTWIDFHR